MKNAVLLSINPKWCEKIAQKVKKIEIRKTKPKLETPFKCYIYCTKDRHYHITADGTDVLDFNKLNIFASQTKVIGEFVCDNIKPFFARYTDGGNVKFNTPPYKILYNLGNEIEEYKFLKECCLSHDELFDYVIKGDGVGYGWHISELKIYDKPKELSEFRKPMLPTGLRHEQDIITKPPQSWCYVEEI